MYYLYVKTHNITGLKYLGMTTSNNVEVYKGSGKYWRRHIRKHGYDVTTEVLLETESHDELKETGVFFSKLWGIVKSSEWANCKLEEGEGGWSHVNVLGGRPHREESKRKMSVAKQGMYDGDKNPFFGKTHSQVSIDKITAASRKNSKKVYEDRMKAGNHPNSYVNCPHCGKHGQSRAMQRWHFSNCRSLESLPNAQRDYEPEAR